MSGIFGVVRRDGAALDRDLLGRLQAGMTAWARDGCGLWSGERAGLAQARTFATSEDRLERQPLADSAGFAFTSAARLDNAAALKTELGVRRDACDGDVALAAYQRWGEDTPAHLLGDWSFAAWHPRECRLFVARDQYGHTSLYWSASRELVAFASSRAALQALRLRSVELDELYIAQFLIAWPAYHGDRTSDAAVRRLAPAHTLTVTPDDERTRCYWRLQDAVEPVTAAGRGEYVERFREAFDGAVRTRVRAVEPIGAELSAGLDSGAVAATAAAMVRERIQAFTSVPVGDSSAFAGERIGDELALAQAAARAAGNIDVHPVPADDISPIAAIRRYLEIVGSPMHAAASAYWLLALPRQARELGCRVVLSGGSGNAGISWPGDPRSQPWRCHVAISGGRTAARSRARAAVPPRLEPALVRLRRARRWLELSAVRPDFARRLDLVERRLADASEYRRTPLDRRLAILMPGRRALLGPEVAAHAGVRCVDPSADIRVLTLVLGVPDDVFIEPRASVDRWLVREAMRGRLPDEVRLNRRRGLQAADLVLRLRAAPADVESALQEIAGGPGAAYVDVPRMRRGWQEILRRDEPSSYVLAVTVLTRGIMAGLHVNELAR